MILERYYPFVSNFVGNIRMFYIFSISRMATSPIENNRLSLRSGREITPVILKLESRLVSGFLG